MVDNEYRKKCDILTLSEIPNRIKAKILNSVFSNSPDLSCIYSLSTSKALNSSTNVGNN